AINESATVPAGTVIGTFTDLGNPNGTIDPDQTSAKPEYKVVIDYGDGTTQTVDTFNNPGAFNFTSGGAFHGLVPTGGHTYMEEEGSPFTLSMTVTHDSNAAVGPTNVATITVNDVQISAITAVAVANQNESAAFGPTTVATFTDAGNPNGTLGSA